MSTSTATKALRLATLLAGLTTAGIAVKCAVTDVIGSRATGATSGSSALTGPGKPTSGGGEPRRCEAGDPPPCK
ncbi:hypothetical protein [Kitasatospora sp. A2-31]|uniref:hypothetical protein n=1 Tax=Kitasatospora sp. A2-31 TaxID=2916414 RepID=UPI001EEB0938|nr:hypothetical protein [Kitasatospora sp. A2-31]MCG6495904.1 hypothetical protein [Kitasatospora sp. A2-31]